MEGGREGRKSGSDFSQDEGVLDSRLGGGSLPVPPGPSLFAGRTILMGQQAAVACGRGLQGPPGTREKK